MFHVFSCTHILSFHSFKLLCNLLRITYYECNVFCRMGHSIPVHLTFICASHNSCGVTQSSSLTLPEKVLNYSKGECFNWSAINPSRLKHPSVKKFSKAIKIWSGVFFDLLTISSIFPHQGRFLFLLLRHWRRDATTLEWMSAKASKSRVHTGPCISQ